MECGGCGARVKNNGEECSSCGCYVTTSFFGRRLDKYYWVKAVMDTVDYLNRQEPAILLNLHKKSKRVLIDLSGVKFIDSMGIGELVALSDRQGYMNQDIRFVVDNESVYRSLESLGLLHVLDVHKSVEEVLGVWDIGK